MTGVDVVNHFSDKEFARVAAENPNWAAIMETGLANKRPEPLVGAVEPELFDPLEDIA